MAPSSRATQRWNTVIVLGGNRPHRGWHHLVAPGAVMVCADGGARHAAAVGSDVTVCVGDFDSIDDLTLDWVTSKGAQLIRHPRDKDETDFELALEVASASGRSGDRVLVVGGTGGRLDHEIGNIALLHGPLGRDLEITALLGEAVIQIATPERSVAIIGKQGRLVSLVPIARTAHGVTTTGLAYALTDEDLEWGKSRGISNVVATPPASVELATGALLVCEPDSAVDLLETTRRTS